MRDMEEAWNELSERQVPDWFHDAKLGIFLHWGLYSVPAWAPRVDHINAIIEEAGVREMYRTNPYSEWYRNSYRVPESPSEAHHRATYGDKDYYGFAEEFDRDADAADMAKLASLLKDAGAEYVVLTTKHHDGFTLWPSEVPRPEGSSYGNPGSASPKLQANRDVVGDLTDAVREAGMRTGLYYSGGYDWSVHDHVMLRTADVMLAIPPNPSYEEYASAHVRELIERYEPSVLWNDIGWPGGGDLPGLFKHFYDRVPDGVINDRWSEAPAGRTAFDEIKMRVIGGATEALWPLLPKSFKKVAFLPAKHADFTTPEYRTFDKAQEEKWEQTRGIGHSFALNRNEPDEDMIGVTDLIHSFVDAVSKNGNMLLGVGPAADGSIPENQQRVLNALGAWLRVNGSAIKGTRPWRIAEGHTYGGIPVRFTQTPRADSDSEDSRFNEDLPATIHAILLDEAPRPGAHRLPELTLSAPPKHVELLGVGPIEYRLVGGERRDSSYSGGVLEVVLPERLPDAPAHTISITLV